MAVEVDKALFGELPRRAQFAGAEGGRRPPEAGEIGLDRVKALRERHRSGEACSLDRVARIGRNAAGILEGVGQKAVIAGGEGLNLGHGVAPIQKGCVAAASQRAVSRSRTGVSVSRTRA